MLYTGISYASVATSIALRGSTRSIHTLSPFKLGTDDLITLSNQHQQRISIHAPPPDVPGRPRIGGTVISYKAYKNVDRSPDGHGPRDILLKFPAVRGFLYYHPGPSHASIAGEVRFRVVDSGRSADFSQGVDLEEPRRPLPWRIPLVTIAQNKSQYKDLCALLLGESHPSGDGPELQPACAGTANLNSSLVAQVLAGTLDAPSISTESVIVHSLGRPFCVDLQCAAHTFHVAHHHRLSKAHLYWMTDQRITGGVRTKTQPYTGSMMCHFERGQLRDRVYTRVLKIIDPIQLVDANYDGRVPFPVEGELLRTSHERLWSSSSPKILQLGGAVKAT